MGKVSLVGVAVLLVAGIIVLFDAAYIVNETEQILVTEFGEPVYVTAEAGLHFKKPFIQKLMSFEKRLLAWDGFPNQIPTLDKKFIEIDTTARWRISDPLTFFKKLKDVRSAQSRLDDIMDAQGRDAISAHNLVETVRSTDRELQYSELTSDLPSAQQLIEVSVGRAKLNQMIRQASTKDLEEYGIELVDFRIKRVNYVEQVQRRVFERMISERERIVQQFQSEGRGKAEEIRGEREKELQRIVSEAYRDAEEIRGKADAEAAGIYAESFGADPEFYKFLITLEVWKESIDENTTLLLSTDSELFRDLQNLKMLRSDG